MFLMMRYQLCPNQENYDRLPTFFQPRPSQLLTPHPIWIDYLPWPLMRDKMTQIYPSVPFDEFFIPYTTTVSLNWPAEKGAVLIATGETGRDGELALNPTFEQHMFELKSWSLGTPFAKAHPSLAETIRVVDLEKTMGPVGRKRS